MYYLINSNMLSLRAKVVCLSLLLLFLLWVPRSSQEVQETVRNEENGGGYFNFIDRWSERIGKSIWHDCKVYDPSKSFVEAVQDRWKTIEVELGPSNASFQHFFLGPSRKIASLVEEVADRFTKWAETEHDEVRSAGELIDTLTRLGEQKRLIELKMQRLSHKFTCSELKKHGYSKMFLDSIVAIVAMLLFFLILLFIAGLVLAVLLTPCFGIYRSLRKFKVRPLLSSAAVTRSTILAKNLCGYFHQMYAYLKNIAFSVKQAIFKHFKKEKRVVKIKVANRKMQNKQKRDISTETARGLQAFIYSNGKWQTRDVETKSNLATTCISTDPKQEGKKEGKNSNKNLNSEVESNSLNENGGTRFEWKFADNSDVLKDLNRITGNDYDDLDEATGSILNKQHKRLAFLTNLFDGPRSSNPSSPTPDEGDEPAAFTFPSFAAANINLPLKTREVDSNQHVKITDCKPFMTTTERSGDKQISALHIYFPKPGPSEISKSNLINKEQDEKSQISNNVKSDGPQEKKLNDCAPKISKDTSAPDKSQPCTAQQKLKVLTEWENFLKSKCMATGKNEEGQKETATFERRIWGQLLRNINSLIEDEERKQQENLIGKREPIRKLPDNVVADIGKDINKTKNDEEISEHLRLEDARKRAYSRATATLKKVLSESRIRTDEKAKINPDGCNSATVSQKDQNLPAGRGSQINDAIVTKNNIAGKEDLNQVSNGGMIPQMKCSVRNDVIEEEFCRVKDHGVLDHIVVEDRKDLASQIKDQNEDDSSVGSDVDWVKDGWEEEVDDEEPHGGMQPGEKIDL